jgi:hypothetical protein
MGIVATALIILVVSFILALRSMSDINFGDELEKFFQRRKIKGSIVFFDGKVEHYEHHSSKSSSSSSS